jgi:CxxC motif-containing protein
MSEHPPVDRLTCVLCPVGCELEVGRDGAGELRVEGNQCDKGVPFAVEEVLRPKRNLATSVPVRGTAARMVSVRLSGPVPREMLFPVLAEIAKLRPEAPVRRGQVLIADVLGSGVDVIATRHQGADSEERPSGARRSDSEPRS